MRINLHKKCENERQENNQKEKIVFVSIPPSYPESAKNIKLKLNNKVSG